VAAPSRSRRRLIRWIVGAVVVVLLVVVGGPFVYFHFIQSDPPPPLSISDATTPTTVAGTKSAPLAGTWKVGSGSVVRYRVKETLFGQSGKAAVGSTNSVTGTMTIVGTKVTAASFTVDMTSISSDSGQRDGQFQGRIMDTSQFPTGTFTLTTPIELRPVPADGVAKSYTATGKLTLHGTTNDVTLTLATKRTGNTIAVQGSQDITFSDYNIDNPSGGPASVGDSGVLEFLLEFSPSATA
jgi:polyisoprenoid-binding protein YceI